MNRIKIDVSQIPSVDVKNLCRTLADAAERFYSDPENQRRFEEWRKSKKVDGEISNKSSQNMG